MRIHIAQTDIAWEDRAANLARADELLRLSPPEPGSLVAFPEMFDTGFSRDAARTADHAGESRRWLRDAALNHAAYTLGG
ncbi:MAG: carbon-nitrogen family hydrolase, partial [Phycisphaerales bacterium]|nr:carbon-nitrogen family hydrolase [Phycisphaerales bacterium]